MSRAAGQSSAAAVVFAAFMAAAGLNAQPTSAPLTVAPHGVTAKCPVELFRQALSMSPEARAQWLATRSPVTQKLLAAKLREYLALPEDQRELRLLATELRWYLVPLLHASSTNRSPQLAAVPAALRPIVDDRLRVWDSLPASVQGQLLNSTNNYFSKVPITAQELRQKLLNAGRRQSGGTSLTWGEMSETERRHLTAHFSDFFDLKPQDRTKVLGTLSETERRQIENTLEVFNHLSRQQRNQCLESFEKFASLSPEERQQFLTDARHWELMSPAERLAWKDLVELARRRPPLPAALERIRSQSRVTTSQN